MNVGPVGSGVKLAPGGRGPLNCGVNSMMKSIFPRPVLSITGRSTPVSCCVPITVASIAIGTFLAPARMRPGTLDCTPVTAPQISGKPPATVAGGPCEPGGGGAVEHG